jgi:hypothetical protein
LILIILVSDSSGFSRRFFCGDFSSEVDPLSLFKDWRSHLLPEAICQDTGLFHLILLRILLPTASAYTLVPICYIRLKV